jgi:energy-coupling factor transporter ATP-binding protein EcfA2
LVHLQKLLSDWLASPHSYPLPVINEAELRLAVEDLERQAAAVGRERVLLNIVLMGGTGVGKSTLLNALAGAPIALASATRPTTRDPVVYHHRSVPVHLLEKPLQGCVLVPHDRPTLENKIIVDTPDLDSNEPANRARLEAVLPVADLVVYVGSQEKYHDQLGWELFRKHRPRRGFAFVLNKWDRCQIGLHGGGVRPDEDLLQDLRREGFPQPLLFRVCARAWAEANGHEPNLPEGEQFRDLVEWLEHGLTQREIEVIKARGVYQLLVQVDQALKRVRPPDLSEAAKRTRQLWEKILSDEAKQMAETLLKQIDQYGKVIEGHFREALFRGFRGIMGFFLNLGSNVRALWQTIQGLLPSSWLKNPSAAAKPEAAWSLEAFCQSLTEVVGEQHLDARCRALPDTLLVAAEQGNFPLRLLDEEVQRIRQTDWRSRFVTALEKSLKAVESRWTSPQGVGNAFLQTLVLAGEWIPLLVLLASLLYVLNSFFPIIPVWKTQPLSPWEALILPIVLVLTTVGILYIPLRLLLPVRWKKIRNSFRDHLQNRLSEELLASYAGVPVQVAQRLLEERRRVDAILDEIQRTLSWLDSREQGRDVSTTAALWEKAATR